MEQPLPSCPTRSLRPEILWRVPQTPAKAFLISLRSQEPSQRGVVR